MTKTRVGIGATLLGLAALALGGYRRAALLDQRLASERAQWLAERAELEQGTPRLPAARAVATAPATLSSQQILARLRQLPASADPGNLQRAVYWLEELGH